MNRRTQGDVGVAEAISYYTKQGFAIFHPLTEATKIDLILEKDGRLKRVQVKTSTLQTKSGSYEVPLRTFGGNQSWNKEVSRISSEYVDEVFAWCEDGSLWVIPIDRIDGKSTFAAGWFNRQYHVAGPYPVEPTKGKK